MKKLFLWIVTLCIIFVFSACNASNVLPNTGTSEKETADTTATKHEHTAVTDEGYAATCTATGLTDGSHCSVCGEVITAQTVIAMLGHTEVTDKGYAATCLSDGLTDGSHCSVCGEIITTQTVIAKLAHTAVTDGGYAATCTATGLTGGSHCSVCGEVLVAQRTIKATGHTPVTDNAIEATSASTGLTEGSHCSVCGEVLVAQQIIPKVEPVKLNFAGGTITKEPTTIKTKHLELQIDANVYVPDNLVETLDLVTDIMEKVSGMKFEGNPNYADGLLMVKVIKDNSTESEASFLGFAKTSYATIPPLDIIDFSELIHECAHSLQFRQSYWHYGTWAMEGISTYTTYKTQKYVQEHYPDLIETVGTAASSLFDMIIEDYNELYSHPMEYWIDNTLQSSHNHNYSIGFRLMWYLDTTYGNYTDWIYKMEEAYPMYVHRINSNQIPREKILEAFYMTYGDSVFDDFYAWLKQNEHLFKWKSELNAQNALDIRNVTQINLFPKFTNYYGTNCPSIFSYGGCALYRDLYIGLDAFKHYLTEYKHKTIDKLVLYVTPGVIVKFFNSNGELMRTEKAWFDKYMDLTGVSFIQLAGEGKISTFKITGYN